MVCLLFLEISFAKIDDEFKTVSFPCVYSSTGGTVPRINVSGPNITSIEKRYASLLYLKLVVIL